MKTYAVIEESTQSVRYDHAHIVAVCGTEKKAIAEAKKLRAQQIRNCRSSKMDIDMYAHEYTVCPMVDDVLRYDLA